MSFECLEIPFALSTINEHHSTSINDLQLERLKANLCQRGSYVNTQLDRLAIYDVV